jgi:hypothetical protein
MPFAILLIVLALAITLGFWPQILDWARRSLPLWIGKHWPALKELVERGLVVLDRLAVAARALVRNAWRHLRRWLLKQVIKFTRRSSSLWVRSVTAWLIRHLADDKVVRVSTETEMSWDDLPADVREEVLRRRASKVEANVTQMRDEELALTVDT